jgi:cation diffusion facilitator CzcD-associated flavoprotein CzcO
MTSDAIGLDALEAAVRRDLEILDYPVKPWLKPLLRDDGAHVHDVIVVGGGHTGVCAAFALQREKMTNSLLVDENDEGGEGPWRTYARMPDLRTRKTVTGAELGYANLTYRAYFEARFGAAAYAELKRITCAEWTSYLLWMRRLLSLPVRNGVRIESIGREGNMFRLAARANGEAETFFARRVVLATGPLSTGGTNIPEPIAAGLPPDRYGHVYDADLDFERLRGKSIVVVGAGASAFDNSGHALEQGAAEVAMLVRRPHIPRLSYIRWADWAGFMNSYPDLDDSQRWALASGIQRNPSPPPIRALNRVDKRDNFHIHFNAPVSGARVEGGKAVVETPAGAFRCDHVLCATGFAFDLSRAPLFKPFAHEIALWKDRFVPPPGGSEKFPNSPYVGRHYEFLEKVPGRAPWLGHIFNFTQSATLSMGPTGRVSGLKYGVRRLVMGIAESFVREDFERHLASLRGYNDSELDGHKWVEKPPAARAAGA